MLLFAAQLLLDHLGAEVPVLCPVLSFPCRQATRTLMPLSLSLPQSLPLPPPLPTPLLFTIKACQTFDTRLLFTLLLLLFLLLSLLLLLL